MTKGRDWSNFVEDVTSYIRTAAGVDQYGGIGTTPWKTTIEWIMEKYECSYWSAYSRLRRCIADSNELKIRKRDESYWRDTRFNVYIQYSAKIRG